jgi:hypothetical protein
MGEGTSNVSSWLMELRAKFNPSVDPSSFEKTVYYGMVQIIVGRVDQAKLPETLLLDRLELCDLSDVFFFLVEQVITMSTLAVNIPSLDLKQVIMLPLEQALVTLHTQLSEKKMQRLKKVLETSLMHSSFTYGAVVKVMERLWVAKCRGVDVGAQCSVIEALLEHIELPVQRLFNLTSLNVRVHGGIYAGGLG